MKKNILGMAAAALLVAGSANASFIMTLDDTSTVGIDLTLQDDDLNGLISTGDISIGSFTLTSATGLSKPLTGVPGDLIHLHSLSVSGGAGELIISLTDTDYIRGGADFLNFNIGGTTNGTVSALAYMDAGNTEFGTGTLMGTMTGTSAFSYTSAGTILEGTDPFSLTLITTVTHAGFGVTSFDAAVVPEPSIIALFGLGLAGLGFAGRRRKQSK